MATPNSAAGGFFLVIAILAGLVVGLVRGAVVPWLLVGTAAGAVLAIAIWLLDRRRTGS